MTDIAYQNKDVASKVTGEALVGRSLAPFGLPHIKIVQLLPTNLPVIESNELRLDNLFLLNDGSIAIIDYESDFKRENFVKYLNYIARVIKRYAMNHQLDILKEIRMIVIYTADVEHAEEVYSLGSLTLIVESAYLINQNSNFIYQKLKYKVEHGEALSEEELTELMILPLTAKGTLAKHEYIVKAVEIAKKLPKKSDTIAALSGLLTFTDKFIDQNYAKQLKEECFMMTQIERLLYEDCWERAQKNAEILAQNMAQDMAQNMAQDMAQNMAQNMAQDMVKKEILAFSTSCAIRALHNVRKFISSPDEALVYLTESFSITEDAARLILNEHWA